MCPPTAWKSSGTCRPGACAGRRVGPSLACKAWWRPARAITDEDILEKVHGRRRRRLRRQAEPWWAEQFTPSCAWCCCRASTATGASTWRAGLPAPGHPPARLCAEAAQAGIQARGLRAVWPVADMVKLEVTRILMTVRIQSPGPGRAGRAGHRAAGQPAGNVTYTHPNEDGSVSRARPNAGAGGAGRRPRCPRSVATTPAPAAAARSTSTATAAWPEWAQKAARRCSGPNDFITCGAVARVERGEDLIYLRHSCMAAMRRPATSAVSTCTAGTTTRRAARSAMSATVRHAGRGLMREAVLDCGGRWPSTLGVARVSRRSARPTTCVRCTLPRQALRFTREGVLRNYERDAHGRLGLNR
jgi:hypothetical protein